MKTYRTHKLIRSLTAAVGGFALFNGALQAAPFLYSQGDLVLAFRQTGSSYDYVVNIGKATNYNNVPPGTTLTVSNLSVAQLNNAFASFNSLKWSVAAANRPPYNPHYPEETLWVVAPRADVNVQSPPWLRKGWPSLATAGAQIDQIGVNAAASSSSQSSNINNTVTGVRIPVNTDYKLTPVIGTSGNYNDTFQGPVENVTPENFDSDPESITRSDLYELLPGSVGNNTYDTVGRYLGYFELKADGTLTFNTITPAPPAPTITSIDRSGNVATVSFTTVSGATYKLRYTDSSGLSTPVSSWNAGGSTIPGTGSVLSLQDPTSNDLRFYAVEAQ